MLQLPAVSGAYDFLTIVCGWIISRRQTGTASSNITWVSTVFAAFVRRTNSAGLHEAGYRSSRQLGHEVRRVNCEEQTDRIGIRKAGGIDERRRENSSLER